jgi:site-specific DNA recombinase
VAALERALADPAIKAEAAETIRSQIERITLTPNAEGTLDIQLRGDLARILELCEAGERKQRERPGRGGPGRELSVVVGHVTPFVCSCSPGLESGGSHV